MIESQLLAMQDIAYRDFQRKLIPNIDPKTIIGVRTPKLRVWAKELRGMQEAETFLQRLPHSTFEENQLHAFLIEGIQEFDPCMALVERFLPFVDNWATCDQLSPKALAGDRARLLEHIRVWLASGHEYTIRFGVNCLMRWYLDDAFDAEYPAMAAALCPPVQPCRPYYVRMAVAWYFATALAKQWAAVIPFIEGRMLETWTHNKAIQKATESGRITPEQKAYLRTLRCHER